MRQAKSVFSILRLDVVMNPPVFNNCAGSLAWIWPVWRAKIMHVILSRGVLPDTKESLTMLFPFSRPKSSTEMDFLKANFS